MTGVGRNPRGLHLGTWRPADAPHLHVPPGHHYSPIPSAADVHRAPAISGEGVVEIPGVELHEVQQWELLQELLVNYAETAAWLASGQPSRFTLDNTWFAGADAVFTALMLRHVRPCRVVEVGSGYSSALVLDVAETFLPTPPQLLFIEPDATRLRSLVAPAEVAGRLLESQVQDIALEEFTALAAGDVLAIDSSHVMKAGSDVHYLLLEVLPRLAPGVWIHMHDIFHPFEYPVGWLAEGVALNEAYAVRAVLQSNTRLRITLWNHFLMRFSPDWFAEHMPLCLSAPFVTGGIWLRVGPSAP